MYWTLESLWRAGGHLERDHGAWTRVSFMVLGLNSIQGTLQTALDMPANPHRPLIGFELQQRKWLLLGVDLLLMLPFTILWMVGALSFARCPRSRLFSFGGVVATLLLLASADTILAWALGEKVEVVIRELGMLRHSPVYLHIGLATGCRFSSTSAARRLAPVHSSEGASPSPEQPAPGTRGASKDEESTLSEEVVKGEAPGSRKESPSKHPLTALHIGSMTWLAAFIISPLIHKNIPLYSVSDSSWSGFDMFGVVFQSAASLVFVGLYAHVAYYYARGTTHLPREIIAGTLFAFTSFGTLRITSSIDTWQSWTIDGLLAFLGFDFGLFAGNRSRVGVSL